MKDDHLKGMRCVRKPATEERVDYVVMDEVTKLEYGFFELTSVPKSDEYPTHTRHMNLIVNKCIYDELEKENYDPLLAFCRYCFYSVLDLTAEEGLTECRIRVKDDLIHEIYNAFADVLKDEEKYEVARHKRWIVVRRRRT